MAKFVLRLGDVAAQFWWPCNSLQGRVVHRRAILFIAGTDVVGKVTATRVPIL